MVSHNILFDLDGTLNDSKPGIEMSYCHTLQTLGYGKPSQASLDLSIGPPLEDNFMRFMNTQDPELISRATEIYLQFYDQEGIHHSALYPHIKTLLQNLHQQNLRLYLATSKSQDHAEQHLLDFGIDHYFTGVQGASRDGSLRYKVDIIDRVATAHQLNSAVSLMIGDHKVDILGGKHHGMKTIGVTYGYGTREELLAANPDALCEQPERLLSIIKTLL